MIVKTTAWLSVEENRLLIGFGPATPTGIWYDTVYTPKLTVYTTAYAKWDNPATSTQMALEDLKDAEAAFFPLYRELYGMMKTSPLVTNAELEGMGLPPRPAGGHSPHPVDRVFAKLFLQPLGSLVLSATFQNRDTGSSVIPYYLTGAVLFYLISDTPVTSQNELTHSKLASRSPHEFIFEPEQRGKMVYMAARWQNRRGELGPWSDIVSAPIP
ncbi:MAG: hypothetical protein LBB83_06145 [Treponema sp.]|jgi:hypothetical protein|nr:hypothetical protein [Treponema sp.]